MARKKEKKERRAKPRRQPRPEMDPRAKRDLLAIVLVLVSFVSLLAFFGLAGPAGAFIDSLLATLFGLSKYVVPFALLLLAARVAFPERVAVKAAVTLGVFLFFVSFDALMNIGRWHGGDAMLYLDHLRLGGGYMGLLLGYPLVSLTGFWASMVILAAVLAASVMITFNISLRQMLGPVFRAMLQPFNRPARTMSERDEDAGAADGPESFTSRPTEALAPAEGEAPNLLAAGKHGEAATDAMTAAMKPKRVRAKAVSIPLDLLEVRNSKPNAGDVQSKMHVIQKTLENFGIPVEMGEVSVGPTVTQFSLKPADGIKLNRITSLSQDLALSLAAHPIRIEAPIPGKSLVGIEVPNHSVAVVSLREVIESKEFAQRKSNLTICLGKDVAGKPWTADLGKMPHMLVAGATGSGKTVCLNTIILSLLFQNGPDDLKLMLIDPKRVELPIYNGIPHLLTPAITEVPKIINALKWAIGEMDRRFTLLSEAGKRDIGSYNEVAEEKMPYLVIVIDELADLMVASAAEVEGAIIRLAQMARAVGIHLIVATQRPSVDVITGLIKANITARVAFSVASQTDSRTILDQPGADKLVGRGDSLFLSADLSTPKRIQGCYVGDGEIRRVVDFLMEQLEEPVQYEEGVTERAKGNGGNDFGYGDDGDDELFEEARDTVVKAGKASASYLQRRLKVGYARAARLLDLLEERGIIGPGDGAKPRQILVSPVGDVDGQHFTDSDDPI